MGRHLVSSAEAEGRVILTADTTFLRARCVSVQHFLSKEMLFVFTRAPAGGGRFKYRAPCPCLTGSCLDLAGPTGGRDLAAFTCSLYADAPCLLAGKDVIKMIVHAGSDVRKVSRYTDRGYLVRANSKREQLAEVLTAFSIKVEEDDLLSRCTRCNGTFIPR